MRQNFDYVYVTKRNTLLHKLTAIGLFFYTISVYADSNTQLTQQRIISIGGALTEIIYALEANENLVGVDTTSLYPQAATLLPSVGYTRTLSSEGILALAPTLVVASEEAGPPTVLQQIANAGVPLKVLPADHRFEGMLNRITTLGELLGRQSSAQKLMDKLKSDWQQVNQSVLLRNTPSPKVLFILSPSSNQILVGGKGTGAQAMLDYAKATNAIQDMDGFKPLTPEAIIAAQPDVILLTEQGLNGIGSIDSVLKLPGISQTPAGEKHRIIALEAMFLLGFGPRMPAALLALDTALVQVMNQ